MLHISCDNITWRSAACPLVLVSARCAICVFTAARNLCHWDAHRLSFLCPYDKTWTLSYTVLPKRPPVKMATTKIATTRKATLIGVVTRPATLLWSKRLHCFGQNGHMGKGHHWNSHTALWSLPNQPDVAINMATGINCLPKRSRVHWITMWILSVMILQGSTLTVVHSSIPT